ncbi:hypothetical protein [Diaphorobacter sp. J5-51]|uniref:hypothetical protein n=1 Tax=Diaphorobacter sp. J5-51 TaxID=680496 RepID=UPI0012FC810F|nr:hypothetical protein [Diaphorobacter sp. J5-51]
MTDAVAARAFLAMHYSMTFAAEAELGSTMKHASTIAAVAVVCFFPGATALRAGAVDMCCYVVFEESGANGSLNCRPICAMRNFICATKKTSLYLAFFNYHPIFHGLGFRLC